VTFSPFFSVLVTGVKTHLSADRNLKTIDCIAIFHCMLFFSLVPLIDLYLVELV
jgi:hypothetical protein